MMKNNKRHCRNSPRGFLFLCATGFLSAFLVSACASDAGHVQPPAISADLQRTVVPAFKVPHTGLNEMSGLARSHNYPGVYWAHNDSGDVARLFAMDREGGLVWPPYLGKSGWNGLSIALAANVDWEDMTSDGEYLYVAETGNNGNARRDLGIYVLPEPNPRATDVMRPLKFLPIAYPEQTTFPGQKWHYDSEALFTVGGELFLITKHRVAGQIIVFEEGANLYRLPTRHTTSVNELEFVASHAELAIVTAADVSPNEQYLAVLCYDALWVFAAPEDNRQWLSQPVGHIALDRDYTQQVEAVTWADNNTILVGNEQGTVFTVSRTRLAPP